MNGVAAHGAQARYDGPVAAPSKSIPRVRPMDLKRDDWKDAPFYFIQTELSPATLYHCASNEITFFGHLAQSGLGAPAYVGFDTLRGPRVGTNGSPMDVTEMAGCWVVAWFSGATGWTNWDSPWVVFLQHKPTALALDEGGLRFEFAQAAGDMVVMPLYGYDKPPTQENDFLARHGLPGGKVKTWEWAKFLPRDLLLRVRYWASAAREFPIYCEESFSVDRAKDTVTIRQRFDWRPILDDWNTPHLKLAPVSPPLALASKDGKFPVKFSREPMDLDLSTPYGPYMGVEGVDGFDATFRVLQYVNETEAPDPPMTNAHPSVLMSLQKLQQVARGKFRSSSRYDYDHGGLDNFCWAIQGDQWYARALPYMDERTRPVAAASLRTYFHEDVLVTNRFQRREFPKGSGREYLILEGPGIGSWGVLGDAGKFSANTLETLWAYAHFTGDWDLIRERWPLVKRMFCTPAEANWVSFGREAIAELGDEAAPCLALARMAYRIGDSDTYNYACYMFARELAMHYIKQRGADYFRRHQPWHSMEFMDEEVFLTNLWGDTAGWQIDGPKYPAKTGERQFNNRWVRFQDADVGRFYRDYLRVDVKRELDWLQERWEPRRRFHNDSHIMPSLVQLRSLLLNETPAELALVAAPGQFSGPPSGEIASCLAVIRTSHPARYERLIPAGAPSPFVAGLEREVAGPNVHLAQAVQFEEKDKRSKSVKSIWPLASWWGWKTPAGETWNFGQVLPGRAGASVRVQVVPINWNTRVVSYSSP